MAFTKKEKYAIFISKCKYLYDLNKYYAYSTIKFYLLCKYLCINKIYVEKNPYTLYSWVAYKPFQNIDL